VKPYDRSNYRQSTRLRVRNYEIDWQGIVHNAVYLLYFETGRLSYLEHIGVPVNVEAIRGESRVVVARNEIDYVTPARFGEELEIFTRVSAIGNSSFTFEGMIEALKDRRLIAQNLSVHVWLDTVSGAPVRVTDEFRGRVAGFEGRLGPGP
jgi:acyl-CoA thioester hydrolase